MLRVVNMHIYVVGDNEIRKRVGDYLKNKNLSVSVKGLKIGEGRIVDEKILTDKGEKILAVADPAILKWELSQKYLEKLISLRGICTKSSWMEYIPLDYCKEKGIAVLNNPGANSQAVAEYAIWMMLTLFRKFAEQREEEKPINDFEHEHFEVFGKTVGIVGLGHIGSKIAAMCRGLGMKVSYWSRKSRDDEYKYVSVEKLLKKSDVVFNCLELCDETKGFFSKERLKVMRKDACFVSVMGGMGYGIEDNHYLLKAVSNGRLAGFAIEDEHDEGFDMPDYSGNVFIPKAYAYYTKEANERAFDMWVENISSVLNCK